MRSLLTTLGEWLAAALVVAGVALMSIPIALIVGGLILFALVQLAAIPPVRPEVE